MNTNCEPGHLTRASNASRAKLDGRRSLFDRDHEGLTHRFYLFAVARQPLSVPVRDTKNRNGNIRDSLSDWSNETGRSLRDRR
jgi:hypothetical protein